MAGAASRFGRGVCWYSHCLTAWRCSRLKVTAGADSARRWSVQFTRVLRDYRTYVMATWYGALQLAVRQALPARPTKLSADGGLKSFLDEPACRQTWQRVAAEIKSAPASSPSARIPSSALSNAQRPRCGLTSLPRVGATRSSGDVPRALQDFSHDLLGVPSFLHGLMAAIRGTSSSQKD